MNKSLREKQIPLNILEVPFDSPRGLKHFVYDRAKLEKGDFVNFVLADIQEPTEEEKYEIVSPNQYQYNERSISLHPEQRVLGLYTRDSPKRIGDSIDKKRRLYAGSPKTQSSDTDPAEMEDDYETGSNFNFPLGLKLDHGQFGDQDSMSPRGDKGDEHADYRGDFHGQSFINESSNTNASPSLRKELSFARLPSSKKKREGVTRDNSPRTPYKHGRAFSHSSNNIFEDDYSNPNSPRAFEQREKSKMSALEMSLNPESRAKLRIIQAIHGENFDKSLQILQSKEKKKIVFESDEEDNEDNPKKPVKSKLQYIGKEQENPKQKAVMNNRGSSAVLDEINGPMVASPSIGRNQYKNFELNLQPSINNTPEKKDPIIRLADEDEEEEDRGGSRTRQSSLSLSKGRQGLIGRSATNKTAGSSRFSLYVSQHANSNA